MSQKNMPEIQPRNEKLKQKILSAPYELCIERSRYYTEVYKETEGEHPSIRAANAFANMLKKMTIYILDEELIVGNRTGKLVASSPAIERGDMSTAILMEFHRMKTAGRHPFKISEEEEKELFEDLLPYWKGKTVCDKKGEAWVKEGLIDPVGLRHLDTILLSVKNILRMGRRDGVRNLLKLTALDGGIKEAIEQKSLGYLFKTIVGQVRQMDAITKNSINLATNVLDVEGHLVIGHNNAIKKGFKGIKEDALRRLEEMDEGDDRRKFIESVIICSDATKVFADRFAALAEEMAAKEEDDKRKDELLKIAENCRWVPWNPPRNFYEAVQFVWFTQIMSTISYGHGGILALGRIDQYLYPFYKKDKEEGRITDEEVLGLLEEFQIKESYNLLILPAFAKETDSQLAADELQTTVGGVGIDGEDATNELSYLWLDAIKNVKLANTNSIRVSGKTPTDFLLKIAEVYGATSGPAVYNDDMVIPALLGCGYSLEDARDYATIGCVEPTGSGNTLACTGGDDLALALVLEMMLTNGEFPAPLFGQKESIATGDPRKFTSFDQLMDAFKRQMEYNVHRVAKCVNLKNDVWAEGFHNPYISSTLDGCIENALDMAQGGAKYNFTAITGRGLGTVADSLAAIKKFVFDENALTMDEIVEMLDSNFRGKETIRQMLINRAPKYGNDDDYVDSLAIDVADTFCDMVIAEGESPARNAPFRPSFYSYGLHVMDGLHGGATPDGRLAGHPVSNSMSPSVGVEKKGATAVLKSAAKIDQKRASNGIALNLKMVPALLKTEVDRKNFVELLRTYFEIGGMQAQFTVVDAKTLREAQANPEEYKDLVVKVSGYSAYFVDLGRDIQNDVISRAELVF